ncbi:ubiquitin-like superfamily protein [Striga asiatica]|uniref:Ubiquitin-like superfamily protein n=1 Tax=Striga asiatica TaxID=4170 RepID=A0A5A7QDG4_STRAF|nr:ubiquitin-like superfamily protein [Striga asiatica]
MALLSPAMMSWTCRLPPPSARSHHLPPLKRSHFPAKLGFNLMHNNNNNINNEHLMIKRSHIPAKLGPDLMHNNNEHLMIMVVADDECSLLSMQNNSITLLQSSANNNNNNNNNNTLPNFSRLTYEYERREVLAWCNPWILFGPSLSLDDDDDDDVDTLLLWDPSTDECKTLIDPASGLYYDDDVDVETRCSNHMLMGIGFDSALGDYKMAASLLRALILYCIIMCALTRSVEPNIQHKTESKVMSTTQDVDYNDDD